MIPKINDSKLKKVTFKGDPNGFVSLPKGSLFRRRYYEYKIMVNGQQWKLYQDFYYEPNSREYENDSQETIWFKTTDSSDKYGWVILPRISNDVGQEFIEETYFVSINDSEEYLLVNETDILTYF